MPILASDAGGTNRATHLSAGGSGAADSAWISADEAERRPDVPRQPVPVPHQRRPARRRPRGGGEGPGVAEGAGGGVYSGGSAWYDLSFHAALAASFAHGENFPPQHPEFAGVRLTYPFVVDFVAAVHQDRLRLLYVRPLDLSVDETMETVGALVRTASCPSLRAWSSSWRRSTRTGASGRPSVESSSR